MPQKCESQVNAFNAKSKLNTKQLPQKCIATKLYLCTQSAKNRGTKLNIEADTICNKGVSHKKCVYNSIAPVGLTNVYSIAGTHKMCIQ